LQPISTKKFLESWGTALGPVEGDKEGYTSINVKSPGRNVYIEWLGENPIMPDADFLNEIEGKNALYAAVF